eukprot:UN05226
MNRNHIMNNSGDNSHNNLLTQIQYENKEQDEVLDDMKTVLERLNVMSQDIGNEINEQDELIHETTQQAEYTRDRMKRVEQQLTQMMKKSGLNPCKVIMILSCMIMLLIFIILYW